MFTERYSSSLSLSLLLVVGRGTLLKAHFVPLPSRHFLASLKMTILMMMMMMMITRGGGGGQ